VNTIVKMVPSDIARGVVVAFSGGADSLALLISLIPLVPPAKIVAVYVNHNLRQASELLAEEALNRQNCRKLRVPLVVVKLERGAVASCALKRDKGLEDAARHLRYEALQRIAGERQFPYIATGHTKDDQGETVLMRLLQGAGPVSMGAIEPQRGNIIRPLLNTERSAVERCVKEHGLRWSEDSTNTEEVYLRNKIRHRLIPVIKEIFPNYLESVSQGARRAREAMEPLRPLFEEAFQRSVSAQAGRVVIDLEQLQQMPRIVAEQVIYRGWGLLTGGDERRFPYKFIEMIIAQTESSWPQQYALRVSNGKLKRVKEKLIWTLEEGPLAVSYLSLLYSKETPLAGGRTLVVEHKEGDPDGVRLHSSTLKMPLVVRSFKSGDVIELAGGSKKVGSLLAEWKIPANERWMVPVMEDRVGIVAVIGKDYGGKNRVAQRCLLPPLVRNDAPLYSVVGTKG